MCKCSFAQVEVECVQIKGECEQEHMYAGRVTVCTSIAATHTGLGAFQLVTSFPVFVTRSLTVTEHAGQAG